MSLQLAVPMAVVELSRVTDDERLALAREHGQYIAEHGDDILYRGVHTREAFAALAKGLAALAYQPGGVLFLGEHWCTEEHEGCPHRAWKAN